MSFSLVRIMFYLCFMFLVFSIMIVLRLVIDIVVVEEYSFIDGGKIFMRLRRIAFWRRFFIFFLYLINWRSGIYVFRVLGFFDWDLEVVWGKGRII